jgi:hypothetical protein
LLDDDTNLVLIIRLLEDELFDLLEQLQWVVGVTDSLPICILLHLVEQDCGIMTKHQGVHFPSAPYQAIRSLAVGPPGIVEGHTLISSSLDFNHICKLKLA